jgi:hypothetical protein
MGQLADLWGRMGCRRRIMVRGEVLSVRGRKGSQYENEPGRTEGSEFVYR